METALLCNLFSKLQNVRWTHLYAVNDIILHKEYQELGAHRIRNLMFCCTQPAFNVK